MISYLPLVTRMLVLGLYEEAGASRRSWPGFHPCPERGSFRPSKGAGQDRGPASGAAFVWFTGNTGLDEETIRGISGRAHQGQGARKGEDCSGIGTTNEHG